MRKVRILLYHRVEYLNDDYNMQAVTPDHFEQHMMYLRDNYDILSLEESVESWFNNGTRDAVIITFDDGYYDFLYNAVPILEKYGIPATIFISTGNIDSDYENWTDNILRAVFSNVSQKDFFVFDNKYYHGRYPTRNYQEKYEFYQVVRRLFFILSIEEKRRFEEKLLEWAGLDRAGRKDRRIMTSEEIKKVVAKKVISIGAHTVTHSSLKELSEAEQKFEIRESKSVLERITGKKVRLFAYPFGAYDNYSSATIELLRDAGFEKAVVAYPGNLTEDTNIFELNRFLIKNYDEMDFADYMKNVVFGKEKAENKESQENMDLPIKYFGKLNRDFVIFNTNVSLVIWGAGYWGKELYSELKMLHKDNCVIAFGDNAIEKCGCMIHNIPIKSLKEIKQIQCKSKCHILIKGTYDFEICKELIKEGLTYIHLIQM